MNIRLDDLQTKGYQIYQDTDSFCFGIDAVLLSAFAAEYIRKKDSVMDLCSGNGIIPILLKAKKDPESIQAVEIHSDMCSLFEKSLRFNNIDNITVINEDIKNLDKSLYNSFDALTVNPPYYRVDSGETSANDMKKNARHEILCSFDDVAGCASRLLKTKGRFFLIHRTPRLDEIINTLEKYSLSVKELRFIYPREGRDSNLFLLRAVKNGGRDMKVSPPLYVYDSEGNYTEDVLKMYDS